MFVAASDGRAKRTSSCGVFACLHEFTRNQVIDYDVLNLVMVLPERVHYGLEWNDEWGGSVFQAKNTTSRRYWKSQFSKAGRLLCI